MVYRQITPAERYTLGALHKQGFSQAEIARHLGRHPSTVSRELRRNRCRYDGAYRPEKAQERTNGRRSRSRRNQRFGRTSWRAVERLLCEEWSPEQVVGFLRRQGKLRISHETIYRHIWRDKQAGGMLWTHLRGCPKQRRKRYGAYDSRGRLAGKRHISERPVAASERAELGHWEIDTVMGAGTPDCIVTLVERLSGYVLIGKLEDRTAGVVTDRTIKLIRSSPCEVHTITSDNGVEFHSYKVIEEHTGVEFYFATPHHSWERGTSENTNGLIRQYLPKRECLAALSQHRCNAIAHKLNTRPRKRLGFRTPLEVICDQ